jgi:hypothetical protein
MELESNPFPTTLHPYILNLKNQMFVIYNEELSEMRELLYSDGCMEIHHDVG